MSEPREAKKGFDHVGETVAWRYIHTHTGVSIAFHESCQTRFWRTIANPAKSAFGAVGPNPSLVLGRLIGRLQIIKVITQ
jgi:hypothetical protein